MTQDEELDIERRLRNGEHERDALRRLLESIDLRVSSVERSVVETRSMAESAVISVSEADDVTGELVGEEEPKDSLVEPPRREPFAYEVIESSGQVYCFVPKKPEQEEDGGSSGAKELYGGAFGGPHFGSKESPKADKDSPPHAAAGYAGAGSGVTSGLDFSWAHFGWHPVGQPLDTSGSGVQEKVVVGTFKVPIDPPEKERNSDTEVEGPSLSGLSLMSINEWKTASKESWKEFDSASGSGASVTRKVPIALVANGLVTQLCVGVPFVERGGNGDGDPTLVDSRDIPSGLPEHLSGKCQKSVDFYEYPTLAPSGLSGSGQYQKTTKTTDPETGEESVTVSRTDDESEADKTVTDILQLYDFTKPDISITEMPVPTPVDTDGSGNESVSGPVFLIRDPGGTGDVCPTLKYTQLKLVDNRCPPPEVWLESGQNNSVTLNVKSWTKNASGECQSGVTSYTFTPTSVDAPDCSGIRACISDEVIALTGVENTGSGLVFTRAKFRVVGLDATLAPITINGTTCET